MKEGWTYKKLGEIATYINGFPFKPSDWKDKGKPIIRIQNLTNPQSVFNRCSRVDIPEKFIVRKGDVLISWSATLGVFEWEKEDAFLNQHIFKVVFNKLDVDKLFFKYVVLISIAEMSKHTNGATMKHIRKGDFDNIQIPFPPLTEQRAIVARLDSAFGHIDSLKANAEKQLSEARKLFKKALEEAMTPKEGWEEKKIKDIAQVRIGPFGSLLHKKDYIRGGTPLVNPIHMVNGEISINRDFTISKEKAKVLSNYMLETDDVVFARRGEVGRCALITKKENGFLCGTGSLFVRFKAVVNCNFMLLLFQSEKCRTYLLQNATGATMLNINASIVDNMPIHIPPLSTQHSIVAHLDDLSSHVRALEEKLKKMKDECDALKQAMLREVFE